MMKTTSKLATFAGGCFWCTEAIFKRIRGVARVVPGYCGGDVENPTYEQVSSSTTGHAEAIQMTYDPKKISYDDLLYIFWKTHDPTTPNRQGSDVGPQYRSMIFYHDEKQKKKALKSKKRMEKDITAENPIVTEVVPFKKFYPAEGYHHDYYAKNPGKMYCKLVIDPKIEKLKKNFGEYLK
jgi:peptide-methionine (S)-S-oxide reductase